MECSNSLVLACFKQIVANVLFQDGCKATCMYVVLVATPIECLGDGYRESLTITPSSKTCYYVDFCHKGFIWRVMYQEFSERRPSGCSMGRLGGLESDGVPRHNKLWAGELLRPVTTRSLTVYASRSTQPGEGGGPRPSKLCSSGSCRPLVKEVQCARLSWRRS